VFLLGLGPQQLVGLADPHGAWLQWLGTVHLAITAVAVLHQSP